MSRSAEEWGKLESMGIRGFPVGRARSSAAVVVVEEVLGRMAMSVPWMSDREERSTLAQHLPSPLVLAYTKCSQAPLMLDLVAWVAVAPR